MAKPLIWLLNFIHDIIFLELNMKSIKINAISVLIVRILNIAFPLITGPYIARVLSKENLAHFDSVNTIVQLFIPLATFGIYTYGIRTISKVKNNKSKINVLFFRIVFPFYHINCYNFFYIHNLCRIFMHIKYKTHLILHSWYANIFTVFFN